MIRHLLDYVPTSFEDYYEPFLGGGALFFALSSRGDGLNAHLSDVNSELINAYKIIQKRPDELIELLSLLQREYYVQKNRATYYYEKRDWKPASALESAGRFIFLNKTCYNGLYRVNSRGEFNVPYGRNERPRILDAENLRSVSNLLRSSDAKLFVSDYRRGLADAHRDDFVYLDPPYLPKSRTSFTSYVPGGFSETDQDMLALEFQRLVHKGCKVMLSNSDTVRTSALYKEYDSRHVKVNRPINSRGSARTGYKETIVLGNLSPVSTNTRPARQ